MFGERKPVGLFTIALIFCSCSIVTKVPVLKPQKSPDWISAEEYHTYHLANIALPAFEFKNDDFSIAIFPCPKSGTNVLVGPPFLPILPNFFSLFNYNIIDEPFFVDVKLANRSNSKMEFNLGKINFRQKDDELKPIKVFQIETRSHGKLRSTIGEKFEEIEQFSGEKNTIKVSPADSVFFRYEFAQSTNKVRRLTLQFEQKDYSIPPLELKTKNKFEYTTAYHD